MRRKMKFCTMLIIILIIPVSGCSQDTTSDNGNNTSVHIQDATDGLTNTPVPVDVTSSGGITTMDSSGGSSDIDISSPYLLYSTYLGGSGDDGLSNWLSEVFLDQEDTLFFTFNTDSKDLPISSNAFDNSYNGGNHMGAEDIAIVGFNIDQNLLKYSSYFGGGSGPEFAAELAVIDGSIYIVGNTGSKDFPVTDGAYDTTFNGPVFRHADGFFTTFDESGMSYSTFIGSKGNESMYSILAGANREYIIVGQLGNLNEVEITNRFSTETMSDNPNAYILRYNLDTHQLLSSSVLGPVWDIDAVTDEEGYIYITGTTPSQNFPVTEGAYDTTYNGGIKISKGDIFITKLTPSGDDIIFSTYLGGAGDEGVPRLCLDAENNIIVYGKTASVDFPITEDAFDQSFDGASELFLSKISADGTSLMYSSYLGGNQLEESSEFPGNIVLSEAGKVFLCGETDATDHPVVSGTEDYMAGGRDIFITVLDPSLKDIVYSTYLGGSSDEANPLIQVNPEGIITGILTTSSSDFPTSSGAYDTTYNGATDIVVFRLETKQ